MQAQRIFGLVVSAFLVAFAPACAIDVQGGHTILSKHGGEKAERRESFPLELAAGEKLEIQLPYGDIAVRVTEAEAPRVDAHWRAGGDDEAMAKEVLARYQLALERSAGSLVVTQKGEPLQVKSAFTTKSYGASVDLTLCVPPGVVLSATSASGNVSAEGPLASCMLKSSYGDISASGVRGDALLVTASGTVKAQAVEGGKLEASSRYGDIVATRIRAKTVKLETSSGDIEAREIVGALSLASSYGDLEIENAEGDLDAVTSSGDITLASHGKATRKLSTSYGDIRVRGAEGDLAAKTSSGRVEVEQFDGSLRAESSYGDVKVAGRLSALSAETSSGEVTVHVGPGSTVESPWRVKSSYGDVTLRVPRADFSCNLEASARSGDVRCEGTETKSHQRKLARVIGAGGPSVQIESTSGDVHIDFH
ncbi:MAG TPA: DUF4097 family beta strand repeat-containing protein [Planctomycetota bacterium]|nr:DUF4097 family beta strand repeat-containing protein [Planctomycetota bacterium]